MLYGRIRFLKHPFFWFRYNYLNGAELGASVLLAFGPAILVVVGLLSDLISIGSVVRDNVSIALSIMLFVYGLVNMILVFASSSMAHTLKNEKGYYRVIHKNIVEFMRDYRAQRDCRKTANILVDETFFVDSMRSILDSFNNNYMRKRYRSSVVATIKYKMNDLLFPVRVGDDVDYRSGEPETTDRSYVYKALNDYGVKLPYLYVKNLDNPDEYEAKNMGKLSAEIKGRAGDNYKTFIALPIRGGKMPFPKGVDIFARQDLGVLGFDLKNAYEFGNFEENELDFIACLADSLGEIILDLINFSLAD